jgi:hypothetical protein
VGERLARLRSETDGISPSAGFERRVLSAVMARQNPKERGQGPLAAVVPIGARALVAALVAAAAAVLAVYPSETPTDEDLVVAAVADWWVP